MINILKLFGTKYEMGLQYGKHLESELKESFSILVEFFMYYKGISFNQLVQQADIFYNKYPYSYQQFIKGIAEGSKIPLDAAKVLNAMETLNSLVGQNQELPACSFLSVPPEKSATQATIIGRNYDFFPPFDEISRYLTVTVLHEVDMVPTALISMPGQIYCPTCINKNSLFVEFNNGMPSAGRQVDHSKETLLINLLESLQNSENFNQLDKQLSTLTSDYSLIVNVASENRTKSFEYAAFRDVKTYQEKQHAVYASTNFFLNNTWSAPIPSDLTTWGGVSRRNNILSIQYKDKINSADVMRLFDKRLHEGGPTSDLTIYQIVYDTATSELFIKRPSVDGDWHSIPLYDAFNDEQYYNCKLYSCVGSYTDFNNFPYNK